MKRIFLRRAAPRLGLAGAMAIALVAGLGLEADAVLARPVQDKLAEQVRKALARGKVDKAIQIAEQKVAADPLAASHRGLLGQVYLRAGRLESAAVALEDAIALGDRSGRTALALSLAKAGLGLHGEAAALLDDWRDAIPPADLGLAYAIAGETQRGVDILIHALRGGENTPKLRQNLAYAYALDGRWLESRVMAAQDVPADQLDDRMSEWASRIRPGNSRVLVASLIGAPMRHDPGMPAMLALAERPKPQHLAQDADEAPAVEAALVQADDVEPTPAASPLAQTFPAKGTVAAWPQPARRISALSHAIQLGSFTTERDARRAWEHYVRRNPELRNFRMVIRPALVRGKTYWRVAAAGLDGRAAQGLCAKVKLRGGGCFAYSLTGAFAKSFAPKAPVNARRLSIQTSGGKTSLSRLPFRP